MTERALVWGTVPPGVFVDGVLGETISVRNTMRELPTEAVDDVASAVPATGTAGSRNESVH